jgi:beta-methylmalyl-CoA/(S)-malyl-CoA lyase
MTHDSQTPMTRLCRTFQTAPAAVPREDTAKYLRSGLTAEGFEAPDWLVPDLEDGTAPDMKPAGLDNTVDLLGEHGDAFAGELWPRVRWSHADAERREAGRTEIGRLAAEAGDTVDGVVVPKVGRERDVRQAIEAVETAEREAGLPPDSLELAVIVETAPAVSDLRAIARLGDDDRLAALVFGPVDYTADLGGDPEDRPEWAGTLETISIEASANDLLAIGGPYDDVFAEHAGVTTYDAAGYAAHARREAELGFDGSWSLHPSQTAQANRVHAPTADALARDLDRIEQFQAAKAEGTGAVTIDGQMVDEATYRTFLNTARTATLVADHRPEQGAELYGESLLAGAADATA